MYYNRFGGGGGPGGRTATHTKFAKYERQNILQQGKRNASQKQKRLFYTRIAFLFSYATVQKDKYLVFNAGGGSLQSATYPTRLRKQDYLKSYD